MNEDSLKVSLVFKEFLCLKYQEFLGLCKNVLIVFLLFFILSILLFIGLPIVGCIIGALFSVVAPNCFISLIQGFLIKTVPDCFCYYKIASGFGLFTLLFSMLIFLICSLIHAFIKLLKDNWDQAKWNVSRHLNK